MQRASSNFERSVTWGTERVRALTVLLALTLLGVGLRAHVPHDPILDVALSPDFARDRTLFVAVQGFPLLLRSTDGGETFETVHAGLRHPFQTTIEISPEFATDRRLWVSDGFTVHESRDAGESWRLLPVFARGTAYVHDMARVLDGEALALATTKGLMLFELYAAGDSTDADAGSGASHAATEAAVLLLATGKPILEVDAVHLSSFLVARDVKGAILVDPATKRQLRIESPEGETITAVEAKLTADGEMGNLWLGTASGAVWAQPFGTLLGKKQPGMIGTLSDGSPWQLGESLPGGAVLDLVASYAPVDDPAQGDPNAVSLLATTSKGGVFTKRTLAFTGDPWTTELRGLRELSPQSKTHFTAVRPGPDFASTGRVFAATFEGLYERVGDEPWRSIITLPRRLVRDAALSPAFASDQRLWLCGYGDGLLQSDDAGRSFRAVPSGPWTYPDGVGGSPDGQTLFLGTPTRQLLSRDGGASWRLAFKARGGFANRTTFAPDFERSGEIFVQLLFYEEGAREELWVSRDAGASWEQRGPKLVTGLALAPDFATSGTLYLATDEGVLVSKDRAETFRTLDSPLSGRLTGIAVADGEGVSADAGAGRLLVVSARNEPLALSRDGGASWERAELPGSIEFLDAATDADGRALVFAGSFTDGLFVSRDDGRSFEPAGGPQLVLDLDLCRDFAHSPTLLVAGYNGPWISRDAARSWELLDFGPTPPDTARR